MGKIAVGTAAGLSGMHLAVAAAGAPVVRMTAAGSREGTHMGNAAVAVHSNIVGLQMSSQDLLRRCLHPSWDW